MKIDFILPDIGEGIVECELVEWHVAEGEAVTEDQPVAEVMTDKVMVEITAMHTGKLLQHYWKKGEIARVGQPLYQIEVEGEAAQQHEQPGEQTSAALPKTPEPKTAAPANGAAASSQVDRAVASQQSAATSAPLLEKPLASPAVRRLARELELDLHQVQGSGKEGRILKEDLLAYQTAPAVESSARASASAHTSLAGKTQPLKGIQAAMAKQMQLAWQVPTFTYVEEIDVTELLKVRAQLKPQFEQQGIKLSLMPLMMKALALAIADFPILNSRVNAECSEITYLNDINIGMAAATPHGLLVPNVKRVQDLTLQQIAQQVTSLTEAARQGRLSAESMQGGTISISNIGALGGTVATPILNVPEVAIVALGRVQRLPRFNAQGEVEARDLIQVSWSGDHRVLDGATMASFCRCWQGYLEQPITMLAQLR